MNKVPIGILSIRGIAAGLAIAACLVLAEIDCLSSLDLLALSQRYSLPAWLPLGYLKALKCPYVQRLQ